uniref:Uncharacterized protein n=1 Tax=Candidatus Kentrum sp. DK TaxID=2126562 RepID=A0A450RVU5_9GAMM|nr:MAG: hypothetical protein BECKDK2373B_GA0170837_100510 [Candidatus Kentron sp. DK]
MTNRAISYPRETDLRQNAVAETAQLDVALTFFGIILVFLSLLTFAVKIEQEVPHPTEYRAIEPPLRPVHTPSLAYAVPFYRFLILDEFGLFALDTAPIAEEIRASTLDVDDFAKTLKTPDDVMYGSVSLEPLDISGFQMQLDVANLHGAGLLKPLVVAKAPTNRGGADYDRFIDNALRLAKQMNPGFAVLNYTEELSGLADTLTGLLLANGWKIKSQPLRADKLSLQRHPDYFILTDYFR